MPSRDGRTIAEEDVIAALNADVALALLPAVLYRSGQFEAALRQLAAGAITSNELTPVTWFFLAMSCHRLGRADEAKAWLAKAVDYLQRLGKPGDSQASERVSPYYRAQLESLRGEAEAVLATTAP